jgi:mediator of RNA polymerase II transcription subunit 6
MDSGRLSFIVVLLVLKSIIKANGQLTNENVFDYFATSMFYDKQSNNQVLRMQTMHTGMPIINEAEELK